MISQVATRTRSTESTHARPGLSRNGVSREPRKTPKTAHHPRVTGTRSLDRNCASKAERDRLIVQLLPLVKRTAFQVREHLPAHVSVDDLVGAGMLGLIDAVRRFDARKRVKLESYARYRIRGAILDGLRGLDTASRDMRKKAKKAEKVHRELEARLGRPVGDGEMAAALSMSLKKFYGTVHELQPVGIDWLRPMEATLFREPDQEALPDRVGSSAFDQCYRSERIGILNRALSCLSERDRELMSLYYEHDLTMKEIGDRLGIDESRVSQIHTVVLERLKSRVRNILSPPLPVVPPAYVVAEITRPVNSYLGVTSTAP
ncbi:MAG TPA: FliA/WhiG family RNA polymerase sigma factor [Terriglobia bacterium]|nr:FliA/WhiG family RNA polymerase sigma factor [Terriglobia bacterium]